MSWLNRSGTGEDSAAGLYTETLGTGEETIVFIPGLGGTTRYWASGVQPLEKRHRVILVDLLGFGRSPKPWTQYTVERQVQELHAVLEPLGPVSLVGHSLGALISVAYTARHPEHVRNITLIGMPYFGSQGTAYRYMRSGPVRGGFLYTNVALTMIACIITRRVLGWLLPYVLRSVPREVAEDLVKHTWRSSTSSLWEVVYRYDAAEDLNRLPVHIGVSCIHGDQDVMAPLRAIVRLTATHPGWRLRVLTGVDHHPFLRDPEGCLAPIDARVTSPVDTDANAITIAPAEGID
ncbi:MAG: alpha/beta fold hydrolase [Woeseia sp.]